MAVERFPSSGPIFKARRWLYKTLQPLDKGDFKWEFLVPFNNKTLTDVDKFIVCSAFIGTALSIQTLTDPGASVGVHLAYIAQFFAYAVSNPIGYRSLAVFASAFEIVGNLFEQKSFGLFRSGFDIPSMEQALATLNDEDLFPIFYDQLFIIINGYYVLRFFLNEEETFSTLDWSEEQATLYYEGFETLGFRPAQFTRLLKTADFKQAGLEGETLTVQGKPIYDLFVPISGEIEVRVDGARATKLPPYSLVGEASLLENLQSVNGDAHQPARATVFASPGSRYVRWPQSAFYELNKEEDSEFGYSIQLMIARALSEKLKAARLGQKEAEAKLKSLSSGSVQSETLALATETADKDATSVEVRALVERGEADARRIAALERALTLERQNLGDLKTVVIGGSVVGALGLFFLSQEIIAGNVDFGSLPVIANGLGLGSI
jgi:CRP-like cAMP-binding protein